MLPLVLTLLLIPTGSTDCRTLPDSAPIHLIGRFSDMQYTEEHAYGQTLELWRAGDCVFGSFERSDGLAGDTPIGLLSEVRYDTQKAGALAFTAKLTTGMTTASGSRSWVPSRDLFTFTGRLSGRTIEGKLRQSNQLQPESPAPEQSIRLTRVPDDADAAEATTYGAWRERMDEVLRFRGPKW
jgi:hypothetical protein